MLVDGEKMSEKLVRKDGGERAGPSVFEEKRRGASQKTGNRRERHMTFTNVRFEYIHVLGVRHHDFANG